MIEKMFQFDAPDLDARTLAHMSRDKLDPTETESSRFDFDNAELHDMIDALIDSLNEAVDVMPPGEIRSGIEDHLNQLASDGFLRDE